MIKISKGKVLLDRSKSSDFIQAQNSFSSVSFA